MKKKILFVVLFLLLFPSVVLAKDTCNNDDIKIEEISIEEKEGYTEELTPVSIDNNKINLNIEMYNVGESITYKIKVKNNSNNDYYFTKDSFNLNTDYIEYGILNSSEVIKPNEEKTIQLKITYKNKISEEEFNENNMMSITLSDTPLSNPATKRTLGLIIVIVFITLAVIFISKNKKLSKLLIGLVLCFIPLSIKALCTIDLEINANITINEKEAIFLPGQEVNSKMKELAGNDFSSYTLSHHYLTDERITAIKCSEIEPVDSEKQEKNIVSTPDSPYPIYMWYADGTIYWWSEAHHPKLNENASYMFGYMKNLTNISSLEKLDASNTTSIASMLYNDTSLCDLNSLKDWNTENVTNMDNTFSSLSITNLDALENWNTSNVKTLGGTFSNLKKLETLTGLKKWDVSKVTYMLSTFSANTMITSLEGLENWNTSSVENINSLFYRNTNLVTLEALRNWNVSNVKSMRTTFSYTAIINLNGLENWDTSKVEDTYCLFFGTETLTSVEALKNWDTSNNKNFLKMFLMTSLVSLNGLEDWNTSKVTNMGSMFSWVYTLEDISAIKNWDVSQVVDFDNMFARDNIQDASPINNWDIQPTANFKWMFSNVPTHPEFSKVPGTWNSEGTFIPS